MPRIHLLDDEDDGVTCRMCLHSFWYKSQLHEHLKSSHSISDPERYEREEREKKLRRIREEQQRHIMAKRQRMGGSGSRSSGGGARRGMPIGRPGRPIAGPRPSFQYRDGAFICDLCKKSFSDGNDMVSHWKSHVKKQRMEGGYRGRGRPAINPSGKRGPGRPPKDGYGRVIRKDYISASGRPITGQSAGRGRGRGRGRGGRSDKGKPRWTSYLVWSTRRRKEIADEGEGFSFAEVAKQISAEWKEVGEEEKEKLQDEAEEMNACGQRKLETTVGSSESESSTSDSDIDTDPEFEEEGEGEKKPIMLKIKREDGTEEEVPAPKKPRSSRERKRPSFFQEFENEENNLDKILDDFELEQIEESKQPKPEKKAGNPTGAGRPRGKRRKRTPSPEAPQEPIELEKSRSGRVRKKPKFQAYFKGEGEEDEVTEIGEESEDDGEFKPDESDEAEEENEEELEEELEEEEVEEEEIDENGVKTIRKIALPPKKRSSLSKKILTDGEIEEATKAAMSAKSTVENEDQDNNSAAGTDAPGISKESESTDNKAPGSNEGVTENNTVESGVANPSADGDASEKPSQEAFDSEVTMEEEPHKEGANEVDEEPVTEQNTVEVASGEQEKEQVDATEVSSAQDVAPENTTELAQSTSETAPIEMSVTSETVESAETPVENATTEPPAPAVDTTSEEDLLASTASSKMEEGDDKFKDIIAESQMDNIFN